MTDEGDPPSSTGDADSLLRAMAATPDAAPEPTPARVAHFRIVGRLGEGGMGQVYRAADESLRRTVALKLLPDAGENEERRQRFLREARSAAAISHPNVAVVYQVGEAEGQIYIAMELIEGENLRAQLLRGRLDLSTAKELAGQIARGLAAAHDKGIVHRDLKPENVMITPSGVVKLLDFGLAKSGVEKAASGKTEAALAKTETLVTSDEGRIMGTPAYMSPEQATGEPLDLRSDVFSFGIVLYETLAGTRPFEGASTGAVLVAIVRDPAPPLRDRVPEVDETTEAVVMRCLAKKPGDRFANAGEVVMALAGQASPKATTQSRTDVEPITRSGAVSRRPGRALVAAGGLAAALTGGLAWWGIARQAPAPAAVTPASASSSPSTTPPHRGVAITDHPPPKTSVSEASAAYARALQAQRGGALMLATDELERATRLDPALAAAQLRASMVGTSASTTTSLREHLAAAEQLRSTLDDRDQMMLKVAEAALAEPPDQNETIARLRALVRRFPDDAESSLMLGDELIGDNRIDEGRAELLRALDLDPEYAYALIELGWSYWGKLDGSADPDRALALYSRCLDMYPSAGTCLRRRDLVYIYRGKCANLDADARTMTVIEPNGVLSYTFLAMALAAENAPHEAIEDALRKRESLAAGPDARTAMSQEASLVTALLAGDLGAAETAARRGMALVEGAQAESEHDVRMEVLLDVLEERGERARALAEAEVFERRAVAWAPDEPWGLHSRLAFMRSDTARIDHAALNASIDALYERGVAREWGSGHGSGARAWWAIVEGRNVISSGQASDVLAKLGEVDAAQLRSHPMAAASLGRLLLIAGRPADAVAPLQVAAQSCTMLWTPDVPDVGLWAPGTIWWMRAHVLLGQALEQTGDTAGACAAYAIVMDRWKNAKPRSVTLDKARERSRALACPKP